MFRFSKLYVMCQRKGMSIKELSKAINISSAAIYKWKNGSDPRPKQLKKLSDFFNVPVEFFLDNSEPLPKEQKKYPAEESNAAVLDGYKLYNIPVYEDIAAGFGVQANDYIIDYMPIPMKSESEAAESMVLHVVGDSMMPKIEDGDYVQVRKQTSVDSGDIAAVLLDEEKGLLKKVVYGADYISLVSLNPSYEPMVFAGADVTRIRILGKAKRLIREP